MKVLQMKKTHETLGEALDIDFVLKQNELVPAQQDKLVPARKQESSELELTQDAKDDYDLARETMRNLVEQGVDALDDMKQLAKQSEHPRAYEVLATLIKTLTDTSKDLYDMHKKTKELKEKTPNKIIPGDGSVKVDKAVFVGTTTDLLRKIKEEE